MSSHGDGFPYDFDDLADSITQKMRDVAIRAGIDKTDPYSIVLDAQRDVAITTLRAVQRQSVAIEAAINALHHLFRDKENEQVDESKANNVKPWKRYAEMVCVFALGFFFCLAHYAFTPKNWPLVNSKVAPGLRRFIVDPPSRCKLDVDENGQIVSEACIVVVPTKPEISEDARSNDGRAQTHTPGTIVPPPWVIKPAPADRP